MNFRSNTLLFSLLMIPACIVFGQTKNGYWVLYGKDRPETGIPANGKVEEGKFVDDRKEGEWVKYHQDGKTPKLKGDYVNNRPSGNYYKFYENGILREEGKYANGKYTDSLKRYYDTGQLEYEAFYNQEGKEEGLVRFYFRNGKPQLIYTVKNGQRVGEELRYTSDGSETDSLQSTTGVTDANMTSLYLQHKTAPKVVVPDDGYHIVFNATGDKDQEGNFKNGLLWEGKRYIYSTEGAITQIEIYKGGYLHSYAQL